MPQLNFENPLTIAQVVWMALIFGALYVLLAQWALPQVASVLDERSTRIASDLSAARIAKAQADAAVSELTQATRQAGTDAQAAIASAVGQAKAEAAEQARLANAELDTRLAEADRRIHEARVSAMSALRDVATETAVAIVTRLTGHPADRMVVLAAVDNVRRLRG